MGRERERANPDTEADDRGRDDHTRERAPLDPTKARAAENSLQSLVNAFQLLELLAREHDLTLTEISTRIQLSKASVYRLLYTLQENGFITRSDAGKRYSLGLRLWEYGTIALNESKVREIAKHHLPRLAAQCGETVNLSVYDRGDALYLETVSNDARGIVVTPSGSRVPAHCSAAGKAMLAH